MSMMTRKDFIKAMALLPMAGVATKLNALGKLADSFGTTEEMPALFVGHGNPMNAITENEFRQNWLKLGSELPRPKAILCISAHWETKGTYLTASERPKTIHDFGGFPQALFDVQYPAPGDPEMAEEIQRSILKAKVGLTHEWGLDHGCWSVIMNLFPNADIPVIQMSLDYNNPPQWHYELAKELATLRKKGIMIIGSGNIVHNLGRIDWSGKQIFDWAKEANEKVKELISSGNHQPLISYDTLGSSMRMAVPTPEHYLPLLYVLGLKGSKEKPEFFNDKIEMGSIAMTSVRLG